MPKHKTVGFKNIYDCIRDNPGKQQPEIAKLLGVSSGCISNCARAMMKQELIRYEKIFGNAKYWYITDKDVSNFDFESIDIKDRLRTDEEENKQSVNNNKQQINEVIKAKTWLWPDIYKTSDLEKISIEINRYMVEILGLQGTSLLIYAACYSYCDITFEELKKYTGNAGNTMRILNIMVRDGLLVHNDDDTYSAVEV